MIAFSACFHFSTLSDSPERCACPRRWEWARFSKIGSEMVPQIQVEEKLHQLAGATEQTFVVAGVPDGQKGERLVVWHKLAKTQLALCLCSASCFVAISAPSGAESL